MGASCVLPSVASLTGRSRTTSTISSFSMPHFNRLKFFIDPLWPLNFFNQTTSTTLSISLTHYNHFKFFIDPLKILQVFHWPTLRATSKWSFIWTWRYIEPWSDWNNGLFNSAAKFVCKNQGNLNENGAYKEMLEKDTKLIVCVFSKMFINVPNPVE